MNTTLLFKGTRFRILLACLFIMACGNAYSTIVSSGYNIGIYDNKIVRVIPINLAAYYDVFDCHKTPIYINGEQHKHNSYSGSYYEYRMSYLKEGVNVIEDLYKNEQEYLI